MLLIPCCGMVGRQHGSEEIQNQAPPHGASALSDLNHSKAAVFKTLTSPASRRNL